MTLVTAISSMHWQPALNGDGVVEGVRDVEQAIRLIVRTPRGSDPHRPTFGSNVHLYVDHPINTVVPHLVRETVDAIAEWEPRATVVKVVPLFGDAGITLRIRWNLADGVLRELEVGL